MENLPQKLIVRPARFAEVRALLSLAESFDTTGGLSDVDEWCHGAECFAVLADGALVGAYALEVLNHANGNEGVIVAAGGELPGAALAVSVLPDVERRLNDCAAVKVETCRPGLAKVLLAQGFELAGFVLRKKIC